MQILLIRHGQSEADLLRVHEGRADYPLTSHGTAQAKKMASRVKKEFPPDFIWASTLLRAKQTASILAEEVECPVEYTAELCEHNNGDLAGKSLNDVPFFPHKLLPHEKVGSFGESMIEFRSRGEQVFSWIKKQSENYKRIAIVCHGGTISRIIESFLQLPVIHNIYFQTSDTGIHFLEYTEFGRRVVFTNSTTHLEADGTR